MAPLKELLDLTYELEALLSLALTREGVPSRLYELIAAKAAAISAAAGLDCAMPDSEDPQEDAVSDSYSLEELEVYPEPPMAAEIEESEREETVDRAGIAVEKAVKAERAESVIHASGKVGDALRKRFSLNDKFRFRRELFGGSDADFSEALDNIAAFDNLSDAEDYLYSQLRMDPDDDNVKSLVEVISGYFS